jgi:hypothetical protein
MSSGIETTGEWREYSDGSKVFFLPRSAGAAMDTPTLVYLTLPAPNEVVLNVQVEDQFIRLQVSRDQLLGLNADIADALVRGRQRRRPNGQSDLALTAEG